MRIGARGLDTNPPLLAGAQAVAFHQTAHPCLGGEETMLPQLTHQTRAAIGVVAVVKGTFQGLGQNTILAAAPALWFVAMPIKSTGRNT